MEIELPDGTILDAPDDADVKAVVAGYNRRQELATVRERARMSYSAMPAGQRAWTGYARPFVELGLGVKDLAGKVGIGEGLTDEDRTTLERVGHIQGGAGTAGRIAGELATFAAPGGAGQKLVTKGITMAPRVAKALRASTLGRVAADVGTTAGVEALKAPTEETSRGDRAAGGAVGAVAGHAVGKAVTAGLPRALRGMRATAPGAPELMDEGIPLTPGMMKGGFVQAAEQTLAKVPIVGGLIRARQREAIEKWNQHMLNEVIPKGTITAIGHEGMKQAKAAFSESYEKLWAQEVPFDLAKLLEDWKSVTAHAERILPPQASKEITSNIQHAFQRVTKNLREGKAIPGQTVSQLDDLLREASSKWRKKGETDAATIYSMARDRMRRQLPRDMGLELTQLDNLYAKFSVLRKAGGSKASALAGGVADPDSVLSASIAKNRNAAAYGQAPLQAQAGAARQVLGTRHKEPQGALQSAVLGAASIAAAPLTLAGRAAYSGPAQRLLTGQTTAQKKMLEMSHNPRVQAMINALRRKVEPGQLGAAWEDGSW